MNYEEINTPYYLLDESRIVKNLEKFKLLSDVYSVKSVLALKCFSTWSVFPLISQYLDGTTSSSLYEAKLGAEKFGKETHAYSVAFSENDVKQVVDISDKIIFNSLSQLQRYKHLCECVHIGIRVNPMVSYSHFDLADPNREFSRLGVCDKKEIDSVIDYIDGFMFHFNCENSDLIAYESMLDSIGENYAEYLQKISWVSLGGGMAVTKVGFDIDQFGSILKNFADKFSIQLYLEPGDAVITNTTSLVTSVLDIVKNKKEIAIVDSSIEAHMLDLLIYREDAQINSTGSEFEYQIAGKSCLAGDVFGDVSLKNKLEIGDRVTIENAGGYTMVKKNWFNGVAMPSIVVKRLNGGVDVIRKFNFNDFLNSLS